MGCYKRNSRGGGEEREGLDNDRIYERQPALDLHRGGRVSNLLSFFNHKGHIPTCHNFVHFGNHSHAKGNIKHNTFSVH